MARIRPARGQGARETATRRPPRAPACRGSPGASSRRARARPRRAAAAPQKAGTVTKAVAAERRGSRFLSEVIAELRKVSWPTRTQLMQSTAVVLVVVAIVAAYLAALDAVFSRMIDAIF